MKIRYDREADVLVIRLSRKRPDGAEEVADGIALLTTARGEIVEIEILRAAARLPRRLLHGAA
jgi:uncharacterized protein YuzE